MIDSIDHALIAALRLRAVDVRTAAEVGMMERDDQEHHNFATAEGRVRFMHNVSDFYRLHTEYLAQGKAHAGLLLARQGFTIGDQMRGVLKLMARRSAEAMANEAVFLGALLALENSDTDL